MKEVKSAVFRIRLTDRIRSVDPDPSRPKSPKKSMFEELFKVLKASPRA
jgi:hypothetical protein